MQGFVKTSIVSKVFILPFFDADSELRIWDLSFATAMFWARFLPMFAAHGTKALGLRRCTRIPGALSSATAWLRTSPCSSPALDLSSLM